MTAHKVNVDQNFVVSDGEHSIIVGNPREQVWLLKALATHVAHYHIGEYGVDVIIEDLQKALDEYNQEIAARTGML